jgi:hypothetical protein
MRSKFIVLFAAVICGNMALAQKNADVPANIKAEFAKKYPTATKVKWEKEEGKYESSFFVGKKEMSVLYTPNGVLEETETKISVAELPAKAQKYAKQKGAIKEAAKIEMANGTIKYEAEVKGKDLLFDDKGNFLEEKAEKEDDKD